MREMDVATVTVMARNANIGPELCTSGSAGEKRASAASAAGVRTTASSRTLVTTRLAPSPAERSSRPSRYAL